MTGPSRGADRTEIHEIEVSGTVRETGPGVTELAVSQQVAAFTAGGGLAAVARTRAEFVAPVPGQLSLAVAAAWAAPSPSSCRPRRGAGLRRVLDLLTGGRLDIAITEVSSLAEVPAVHQLLAEGRGEGKYVARLVG